MLGYRTVLLFFCFLVSGPALALDVHEGAFKQAIDRLVGDRVMGYAFVVADRDGIVAEAADGWAQAPGDGALRMSTTTASNVGSLSKVLSGIALLDLLEARGEVGRQLDTPIRFFVPDKWIQAYFNAPFHDALNAITFRHLLAHKSGLPLEADAGPHGTKIARALSDGPNAIALSRGFKQYNNNNFTLLLYLIPALVYPDDVDAIERRNAGLSLAAYNKRAAEDYGRLYERYMRNSFLLRVAPRIEAGCRTSSFFSGMQFAKQYSARTATSGVIEAPDFCRSQGSWMVSAQHLAHFARAVEFTDTLIDKPARQLMSPKSDGLIFWRSYTEPLLTPNEMRAHGGSTNLGARAVLVRLPDGYVGTAVANSPELSSIALGDLLVKAFYEATRIQPEWNTDRPGADLRSFQQLLADPAICRKACNDEAACRAWTYVKPGVQHPITARCYLKRTAPAAHASGCCTSGVKGVAYERDRPGEDYRSFDLGRADAALCQAACGLDARCRAWTYVEPGRQGGRARCWLKDAVPPRKKAACCATGRSP